MEVPQVYGHINDICMIGHGSIGKGTVPLIKRHFTFDRMTIIDPDPVEAPEISENVHFLKIGLTKENFKSILDNIFKGKLCFCVNLSVGTSSSEIIQYCQEKQVFYIDTVKEEWEGYYSNEDISIQSRSNFGLRDNLLKEVRKHQHSTTAVSCCGANPGMVSWMVKQALINLAGDLKYQMAEEPKNREEWALLMRSLGVKGIHIAQRDTQKSNLIRPLKSFWNTWSVDGFIAEGFYQPAELGWGTFERWMPKNAKTYQNGQTSPIYLNQPGMNTRVKTWCPTFGAQFGFLVTHDEAISISDYYTVKQNNQVVYRPTCHYAYHPCEDAIGSCLQSIGSGEALTQWKILQKQITEGIDELGVLLYGHAKNAYWFGSQLDIKEARKRAPNQNATALQVTSSVIAGMVWALQNPNAGLVEPDEMDYKRCLEIQRSYVSPVKGYYTDWNPLSNRRNTFENDFDLNDPWQFKNVIMDR